MKILASFQEWIVKKTIKSLLKNGNMGDFLKTILLKLLDRLKTKSLPIYLMLSGLVTALFALANNQAFIAFLISICEPCGAWVPKVLEWVAFAAGLFGVGVHTTVALVKEGDEKAMKRLRNGKQI